MRISTVARNFKKASTQPSVVDVRASVVFSQYAPDPIGFIKEILAVKYLTPEQEAITLSVRDRRVTNVKAAHSQGKSFVSACLVLWHVFAVGGLAITSAPTEDQVKEILWMEVRRLYE